jgi:ABC-2 type transport system permease protein
MIGRIAHLIVKDLIQFRRDRILLLFLLLAPALQLILMARAVERGIREQPVVIVDLDHSRSSRELAVKMDNTEELRVRFAVETLDEMRAMLDSGQARLGIVIPQGFGQELGLTGDPQGVQVIADGTNTMAASITMRAATGVVGRFASDLAASYGLSPPQAIDLRTRVRFNPSMDVRDFTIPAQLGFIIYQITLAVASLGLARERELGTLEQLMVTPLRRWEVAMGKGVPAIAIGMLNYALMFLVSQALFHVPMNGSLVLLSLLSLVFIAAVVSWGVVISAVSRTQQQAILFVFIQAMVDMTLSGFLVPVRNMPTFLRALSRVVPLQYYMAIVRGIMLKGAGLPELWPQALALTGLCLAMGLVAFRSVARRLD